MLTIGLTGGIASGKSAACEAFAKRDITIVDADKIARALFAPESPHLTTLREKFGSDIFDANNHLVREKLKMIVFNDPESLAWLNDFTHPLVHQQMLEGIAGASSKYVILDIPLLVDINGEIPQRLRSIIDRVLVVKVNLERQIARLIKRDQLSEENALKIIKQQSSLEQKLKLADDVIDNNTNLHDLSRQVDELHRYYLSEAVCL